MIRGLLGAVMVAAGVFLRVVAVLAILPQQVVVGHLLAVVGLGGFVAGLVAFETDSGL